MKWITLLLFLSLISCQKHANSQTQKTLPSSASLSSAQKLWQCPMHPKIIRNHADHCPICGMNLVPIPNPTTPSSTTTDTSTSVIQISPAVIQKTGVKIIAVNWDRHSENIPGFGTTALNENLTRIVSLRVDGFVEKVAPLNVGSTVQKGQILAWIYSPQWNAALSELLLAQGDEILSSAARTKALRLGLDPSIIQSVQKKGQIPSSLPVFSPQKGTILSKGLLAGQSVNQGQNLYQIADLNQMWIQAEFPQSALLHLQKGQQAQVLLDAQPQNPLQAKVLEILPQLNDQNRSVQVRLSLSRLPNPIQIGQSARIQLQTSARSGVYIPENALLPSGEKSLVIQSLGQGRFKVIQVQTGIRSAHQVQILSPLAPGDSIVESAQFLIDAESNLQSAILSFDSGVIHAQQDH